MVTIPLLLVILAILFALLGLFGVGGRVSWAAAGVLFLGASMLMVGTGVLQ